MNGMAKKARNNIYRAFELMDDYSDEKFAVVQEKENLIDKYEDKLGTYLIQLTGREMNEAQKKQTSKFLYTISERIGDHASNISKVANELYEKKMSFSEDAEYELEVSTKAVKECVDLTVEAFVEDDLELAKKVEPLRQVVRVLCNKLKNKHIERLQKGKCDMKQGFAFNDMLTNLDRITAHCSNVAVAMIELESSEYDTHEYLKSIREMKNEKFLSVFEDYVEKYSIDEGKNKKVKEEKWNKEDKLEKEHKKEHKKDKKDKKKDKNK